MNTPKIAALYTRYPSIAQLLDSWAPDTDQALLSTLLLAQEEDTHHEIRVKHFAPEGLSFQQLCPRRVFDWACAQFPAGNQRQPKEEVWSAMANDFTQKTGGLLISDGSAADFTTLLRGLRHYRRKLNRGTRKQLAQLRTYHQQQLDATAEQAAALTLAEDSATAATLATLAAGREVCCLHLPIAEYNRREELAKDLVEQKQKRLDRPNGKYGREIMWHPDFAADFVSSVADMGLPFLTAYLSYGLVKDMNQGNALDLADYAYLADCLREGLANNPTPLAALRLNRALGWVEQAGGALLATEPTALTSEAPGPVLSAA